mgnify:FL=1
MDHDLRYDSEETQYNQPTVAAPVKAEQEPDCTVWTATVDRRLDRLERAVERLADTLQVLILRMDDGK